MVSKQTDQVQASETGGGGPRQPAEEEGQPPHQQMAPRHQTGQLGRHRRHLRGLAPPPKTTLDQPYLLCNIIDVIRPIRGGQGLNMCQRRNTLKRSSSKDFY